VVSRNGESGIFVVNRDDSIAHYVPVKTGIVTPDHVEILSPVITGLIVTLGQHLLDNGSPVLLPKTSPGTTQVEKVQ